MARRLRAARRAGCSPAAADAALPVVGDLRAAADVAVAGSVHWLAAVRAGNPDAGASAFTIPCNLPVGCWLRRAGRCLIC